MKKEVIKIKIDVTKRKKSPEELAVYLREKSRGCGVNGVISRKTERRKYKQKLKKEKEYE